jgi:hypothetical protein
MSGLGYQIDEQANVAEHKERRGGSTWVRYIFST